MQNPIPINAFCSFVEHSSYAERRWEEDRSYFGLSRSRKGVKIFDSLSLSLLLLTSRRVKPQHSLDPFPITHSISVRRSSVYPSSLRSSIDPLDPLPLPPSSLHSQGACSAPTRRRRTRMCSEEVRSEERVLFE